MFPRAWGNNGSAPCPEGGAHCNVQDLLLLDLHRAELRELIRFGNDECGTRFPADVSATWAEGGAAVGGARGNDHVHGVAAEGAPPRSPPAGSLVGEREHLRSINWVEPATVPAEARRPAVQLPDGSWSCKLEPRAATANAPTGVPLPARGLPPWPRCAI